MNSEEKYLDELLKSMTESAPKERSMQDVMREMMGVEIPTPEPREQTPAEESVVVPDIISESAVEPVREDNSESNIEDVTDTNETVNDSLDTNVSEPTAEDLANLLDNIEMNFEMPSGQDSEADAISLADMEFSSAEIEPEEKDEAILPDIDLAAMLDDINLDSMIISEPVGEEPVLEEPAVEETVVEEPAVEGTVVEEPVVEEPVVEEPVVEEPVVEEPVVEEPVVEEPVLEAPVEETVVEEPVEEPTPIPAPAEEAVAEEPIVEAPIVEDAIVEEPVAEPAPIPAPEDPNAKMSDDDIAALIASMNGDSAPAEEPVVEETVVEEIVVEEPVAEPTPIPAPADPNAKMSDDDIAALIASMNGDSAPAEEPVEDTVVEEAPAKEPAIEEPGAAEADEEPIIEEPVSEEILVEEPIPESAGEDIPLEDDVLQVAPAEPSDLSNMDELSQDDMAAMLAELGLDDSSMENTETSESDSVENAGSEEPSAVDMLDNIGDSEEDLLALLEGIDDSPRDPENEPGMESDVTDSVDTDSETSEDDSNKKKKKKKGFKLPFFGKKNKEEQGAELQDEETEAPIDSEELFEVTDETESDLEEQAPENDKKSKKGKAKKKKEKDNSPEEGKKIGFFAKILAFLSEEDEDEEEEPKEVSNDDIIAEVDAENAEAEATASKGKKGKKAKKNKKDKKGNAPAAEGAEGEEGGENANAKAKPKKEKKPKEPKEPKPKEPKVIVLSKPAAAALTFAVISVIAAVVFASILLPEYFDKQEGRKAYYAGDYMTTYRNLYSVSRNNSDEIMFKRAEMVVALDRRIDSYNARMALGQEVEALDSLIEGVCVYRRFSLDADITTISILQQRENIMLDILGSKFGLSEKDAFELYELDEEEYTKRLYSIVYPDAVFEETTDPENDTIMNPEESGLQEENVGESEATETETNTESVENQEVEDNITQEVNIEDILPEEADMMGL